MDIIRNLQPYTFLLALLLIGGVIISQTWRGRRSRWLGIAAALLVLGGWYMLRPGAAGSDGAGDIQAALAGSGRPVIVELYSDY